MLSKISRKVELLNQLISDHGQAQAALQDRLDDAYAAQLLQRLFSTGAQLPVSNSSLKMHSLALVVNDIIVNQRRNVVELGAGISTVIISRLFRLNGIAGHLVSVEENQAWIEILERILRKEELQEYVTFIHAPLKPSPNALGENAWYSEEALDARLAGRKDFDLVLADGPSAWRPEIAHARYPAFPYFRHKLSANFSFYLDDANREGEQYILSQWQEKYRVQFNLLNRSLAVIRAGVWYNTSL